MSKSLHLVLVLFAVSVFGCLSAESCSQQASVRVAAFRPSGQLFRSIYGNVVPCFEVEVAKKSSEDLELWINWDTVFVRGQTVNFCTKTRFANLNISSGFKRFNCRVKCLRPYIGFGINTAFVYVVDDSTHVTSPDIASGIGVVGKTGVYFKPQDNYFFELFLDYLYQKVRFEESVQIGGAKIGIGAGINF